MTCDAVGSRCWTMLAFLTCAGLACSVAEPAAAAPATTSFDLTGSVSHPANYGLADLQAFTPVTEAVTYGTGSGPVSATYTGASLYALLSAAGLQAPAGAKNGTLRDVVVATGSDGYAAAFSVGELDPRFGGKATRPNLIAYQANGAALGADGFARVVAPGDAAGGRYVSNLAALEVVQAPSNPAQGGGPAVSFTLSGLVSRGASYDHTALATLPSVTESVTYTAAGSPVSATYVGVPLWSLLSAAGLVTDPAIKNDELRFYVLATGSDGYEAAVSFGELDPRFGGSASAPDIVAYAQLDAQGNPVPLGVDGFARLVVPGDAAGGRYVSDLVSLQVLDATAATAVPEPGSRVLLLTGLAGLAARRLRNGVAAGPLAR